MNLKLFIKRIFLIIFTRNPYKTMAFKDIMHHVPGESIDIAENLSFLLLEEHGDQFDYSFPYIINKENAIENYIRDKPRFKYTGILKEPTRVIMCMSDVFIIGQLGLVYDQLKRSFVEESAKEWSKPLKESVYLNMVFPPTVKNLNGTILSFLTNGADGGFYHFLFESFVKLKFYGINLNKANHYLFNGPATPWKLKWLKQANVNMSKIIWIDNLSHFKCEQLLFTNRLVNDQQISKWAVKSIKELIHYSTLPLPLSLTNKIIWLTRAGIKARHIIWENSILSLFPNIVKVDFESQDIQTTANILQAASHIISPHGAALSNIFLCIEKTKVLELYPYDQFYKPCYARLSSICNLAHNVAFINFNDKEDPKLGLDFLNRSIADFIKT